METYTFEQWMSILHMACVEHGTADSGLSLPLVDDTENEELSKLFKAYSDGISAWSVEESMRDGDW